MLEKRERCIADCAEALRRDPSLHKVRARMATACTQLGKMERAADILAEGVALGGEHAAALSAQLATTRELATALTVARAAFDEGAFSRAKREAQKLLVAGVADENVHLLLAKAHLALKEAVEAARAAQKAIAVDADCLAAYLVRAEALHAMGLSDKAIKHLREALQRDPDNSECSTKLKRLKRIVDEKARIHAAIADRMQKRLFEQAAALGSDGLKIDADDKKLCATLHVARAEAFKKLALSRARGETRKEREAAAAAKAGGGGSGDGAAEEGAARLAADAAAPEEEEDRARARRRAGAV